MFAISHLQKNKNKKKHLIITNILKIYIQCSDFKLSQLLLLVYGPLLSENYFLEHAVVLSDMHVLYIDKAYTI